MFAAPRSFQRIEPLRRFARSAWKTYAKAFKPPYFVEKRLGAEKGVAVGGALGTREGELAALRVACAEAERAAVAAEGGKSLAVEGWERRMGELGAAHAAVLEEKEGALAAALAAAAERTSRTASTAAPRWLQGLFAALLALHGPTLASSAATPAAAATTTRLRLGLRWRLRAALSARAPAHNSRGGL